MQSGLARRQDAGHPTISRRFASSPRRMMDGADSAVEHGAVDDGAIDDGAIDRGAIGQGAIDYEESGGDGPTIVLVPGSCSTGAAWRPVIAQLGDGFRCVTTSLLGYGGTAERRTAFDADIAHEAEIVEAVIRRASGPVHLVGHSFGGLVSLAVALRNRVPVLSLVIIEAPVAELLRHSGEREAYSAFLAMTRFYFAAHYAGERTAIKSMVDFYGGPGTFAAWPDRVRRYAIETTPVNILDWAAAYGFGLTPACLARIRVPTLVLRGAASPPAMQRANALLAQNIEDASVITVAGAAHFMISTHAEEVAWAIAHHVTRIESLPEPAGGSSVMFAIPMHNRFAEGFGDRASSGAALDPLSSRIDAPRLAEPDFDAALRRASAARSAALGAALLGVGRCLAAVFLRLPLSLIRRVVDWHRRERATRELYSVDDRTLADLGLRRTDIPYLLAQGGRDLPNGIDQHYRR